MKKICFITTVSGTLKTFVLETAKYLYGNGEYDITFICDNDDKFADSLPDYIHFIPVSMSRGVNIRGFKAIKEFKKIFKEQKFDIVQYSTPNASFYASIAAKRVKVPVRLYCQWGIRYAGFSGISRWLFKALEKLVCKNSTDIRAVSPMNKDFAIAEGLYNPSKVKVLGRGGTIGVELAKYRLEEKQKWRNYIREKYEISQALVYGFAGRLSRDKGANELLTAFRNIAKNDSDVALFIVGPDETRKDIDAEILTWAKNSNQVFFTGRIPNFDMPKYYAAMDVLVHPTYREGFGMVIQEAASMQVAVLTTKIPGASEVLENYSSCLLCDAQDADSLYKKMLEISDPVLQNKLASEARVFVEAHYVRNDMLKRQFEDYESM